MQHRYNGYLLFDGVLPEEVELIIIKMMRQMLARQPHSVEKYYTVEHIKYLPFVHDHLGTVLCRTSEVTHYVQTTIWGDEDDEENGVPPFGCLFGSGDTDYDTDSDSDTD